MGNVVRLLAEDLDAVIDLESFPTPEIFFEIQRRGPVSAEEMVRVFNCGLGMVVALEPRAARACRHRARPRTSAPSSSARCDAGTQQVVLR